MLYFAGTDWFLLSWRLLPLPTPHMVESARSSSTAYVYVCVHVCFFFVLPKKRIYPWKNKRGWRGGGETHKRDNSKRNPKTVILGMCVHSQECASICVFFTIRQCVKMSRFDCRRFMSHNWWLTIHLPWTCTHALTQDTHWHTGKHTSLSTAFIHWPWRICAGSLTHAYLHWTHTHSPTQRALSKGYCVWVCVCLSVRSRTRIFKGHFKRGWPLVCVAYRLLDWYREHLDMQTNNHY